MTAVLNHVDQLRIQAVHAEQLTMCAPGRCAALILAIRNAIESNIPGDVVICGVWRGGLAILAAQALQRTDRTLHLYDTFEGMPEPGELDGKEAAALYARFRKDGKAWCRATVAEVRQNLARHCRSRNIIIRAGDVARTLRSAPNPIAVAYLDTDFYASTRAELEALYPKLSPGGSMFFDDYGRWPGCRAAVDDYFGESRYGLLQSIDNGCSYAVKP